jgi:hypothetical protein
MTRSTDELSLRIAQLPEDWHGAGTISLAILRAIAAHAARLDPIRASLETGAGRSTLLFSHLSARHLVFAVDEGGSLSRVRQSPLLNPQAVTFIEGPTQRTLPRHSFSEPLQIAFLDGPHGYPFPDLEYFYIYPHLATGGLLILDDIRIPTIRRMVAILKAGDMFRLVETVDGKTAFFRRTAAPAIDPEGDAWWLQGYNRCYYARLLRGRALRAHIPNILRKLLRGRFRRQ